MPLADWFSQREGRRYTRMTSEPKHAGAGSADLADGVWVKCDACNHTLYEGELVENLRVCRHCGHHLALTAPQRIETLADPGSFTEVDSDLEPGDPLGFVAAKSYQTSLESARERSELPEAIVVGRATVGGTPVTPVEWWDPHWIRDRIERKLEAAGIR